ITHLHNTSYTNLFSLSLHDALPIYSYPRTDCNFITESEFNYLSNNIKKLQELYGVEFQADTTPKKRFVDNKKVEEHFALIPTKKDRKSTRMNSSHVSISYAVFCLKK